MRSWLSAINNVKCSTRRCASTLARYKTQPSRPRRPSPQSEELWSDLHSHLTQLASPRLAAARDSQRNNYNAAAQRALKALKACDFVGLKDSWTVLKSTELISSPRHPILDQYSNAIAANFVERDPKQWSAEYMALIQDISLHAALYRCTNGLTAYLRWLVRQRDSSRILEIYEKFHQSLGVNESWGLEDFEPEGQDTFHIHLDLSSAAKKASAPQQHPGRVDILLAAITAHAMNNTFDEALKMCLRTSTRFSHRSTRPFIEALGSDPLVQQRMNLFTSQLKTATLVARPTTLAKVLSSWATSGLDRVLEKVYNEVLDGLSGDQPYMSIEQTGTPTTQVVMTEAAWIAFLYAFMQVGRKDLAGKLWSDLHALGVKPTVSLWNAAIDGYTQAKQPRDAVAVWNLMLDEGVTPNARSFRAVIAAHFLGQRRHEAYQLYQHFWQHYRVSSTEHDVLAVNNAVLNGLLSNKQYVLVHDILRTMRSEGPAPDVVTYNTLLGHYGRRQDFQSLAQIVSEMSSEGVTWDVFTFSTILSALLRAGKEDAPSMIVTMMRKQRVLPKTATFTAIIDQQLRLQEDVHLHAALRLLDLMEHDPTLRPNDVTYTAFLAGIFRDHWLPVDVTEDLRNNLLGRMVRRKVRATTPTYHVLFRACLHERYEDGPRLVMEYFRKMEEDRVPIVTETWSIILTGLWEREAWEVGAEIVKEMENRGLYLSPSLTFLVNKIKKRISKRKNVIT